MTDPASEPVLESIPPAAPRPPILPIERFAAAGEILLCSGFPTQIMLIGLMSFFGMKMRLDSGALSPPFIFTLSLLDSVLIVGLVIFLLHAHRESPRDVLIGRRPLVREALLGVVLVPTAFFVITMILVILYMLAPYLHNVPRNPFKDMLQTPGDALVFGMVVMIAGGVREEVQRAFVLHRFERFLGGALIGIAIFSTLFGLGHIDQGYDAAIATGLLGALWGFVYLARRSIVAPMVSHAGFNLAQLAMYWIIE